MKYLPLLVFLVGCAGSPRIDLHITKNVYVIDNQEQVTVTYTTKSGVDVDQVIEQQIRDLLKIPAKGG